MRIAEHLSRNVEWSTLRDITGTTDNTGKALRNLLSAPTADAARQAYWQLENHIVAQGTVFEAAVPATMVLMAALAGELPIHVRIAVLDLLYQILSGTADATEVAAGNGSTVDRCRNHAREGLWGLVHESINGPEETREAARDVLRTIAARDDLFLSLIEAT